MFKSLLLGAGLTAAGLAFGISGASAAPTPAGNLSGAASTDVETIQYYYGGGRRYRGYGGGYGRGYGGGYRGYRRGYGGYGRGYGGYGRGYGYGRPFYGRPFFYPGF